VENDPRVKPEDDGRRGSRVFLYAAWYKLELLRRDVTIRLGAMLIASTGVLLTAMRLMAH